MKHDPIAVAAPGPVPATGWRRAPNLTRLRVPKATVSSSFSPKKSPARIWGGVQHLKLQFFGQNVAKFGLFVG